jgi:hypothetical protein
VDVGSHTQENFGDETVFWLWAKTGEGMTVIRLTAPPSPAELADGLRRLADAVEESAAA